MFSKLKKILFAFISRQTQILKPNPKKKTKKFQNDYETLSCEEFLNQLSIICKFCTFVQQCTLEDLINTPCFNYQAGCAAIIMAGIVEVKLVFFLFLMLESTNGRRPEYFCVFLLLLLWLFFPIW